MKESRAGMLTTAKERVKRYLLSGDVILIDEEVKMLARWELADRLMREKKPSNFIINKISLDCHVSKFTARNDMFVAQELFGAVARIDKTYILYLKFERQQSDIERLRLKMTREGLWTDSKLLQALAKMEEAATYTMNSIPTNTDKDPTRRPVLLFAPITQNFNAPMSTDDAMQEADRILNIKANENPGN